MKKIAGFIVLSFLCGAVHAQDQDKAVKFGVNSGLNLSILSSSVNSESSFRAGFHAGIYLDVRLSDDVRFQPEVYYSQQGEKSDYSSPTRSSSGSTTTSMNYLNIPILFKFRLSRSLDAVVGPQYGKLLSAHEKGTIDNKPVNDDLKDVVFKTSDLSGVVGLAYNINTHFNLGVRLNYGFKNLLKDTGSPFAVPEVKSRAIHFVVGYSF